MKLVNILAVKEFEEDQRKYGTNVALSNYVVKITDLILVEIGMRGITIKYKIGQSNKERDKYLYNFGMKTPKLSKKGKKMFKKAMGERNPI